MGARDKHDPLQDNQVYPLKEVAMGYQVFVVHRWRDKCSLSPFNLSNDLLR